MGAFRPRYMDIDTLGHDGSSALWIALQSAGWGAAGVDTVLELLAWMLHVLLGSYNSW